MRGKGLIVAAVTASFTRCVMRGFGSTPRSETFIFYAFPKVIPG